MTWSIFFVFMQCSVILNLVVFQKLTGIELARKGYALCMYYFNKKMKEDRSNSWTGPIYEGDVAVSVSRP